MFSRPVILAIDDEPEALAAMMDALMRRFGADYRVVAHFSALAALKDMEKMRDEGEQIALIIADQWMPEMDGLQVLAKAHPIHPHAQRALLVTWGDRTGSKQILEGCAFGMLENYLLKPWAPAEIHLYPHVSEYLAEWTRAHGPKMEIVRVIGQERDPKTRDLMELLIRNSIPYGFYDVDSEKGATVLEQVGLTAERLPVITLLDGHTLVDPTFKEIADALGANDDHDSTCDVAIVGGGPAGLAAAVYAASEGLGTVLIEKEAVGGQAGTSSLIRNYLGFPRGISGADLAQRAYQQAWAFGAKFVFAREAESLRADGDRRIVRMSDGTEVSAKAVIIATGATYRRLPNPRLARFEGAGIFYTALGYSPVLRGQEVFIAGAGNSAGQAVLHLAREARKIHLIVRGENLERTMSDYLIQQITHTSNIEVHFCTEVVDGDGENSLECLVLRDTRTNSTRTVEARILFVLIGALPHTDWLADALERDAKGFIKTGQDVCDNFPIPRDPMVNETSIPGVFAVGDVRMSSTKRVASAVGEGAVGVASVHQYLETLKRVPEKAAVLA